MVTYDYVNFEINLPTIIFNYFYKSPWQLFLVFAVGNLISRSPMAHLIQGNAQGAMFKWLECLLVAQSQLFAIVFPLIG